MTYSAFIRYQRRKLWYYGTAHQLSSDLKKAWLSQNYQLLLH